MSWTGCRPEDARTEDSTGGIEFIGIYYMKQPANKNPAASSGTPGFNKQDSQPGQEYAMTPPPEYIKEGYKAAGKLEGKIALVTRGDSGIGRSVSVHYAREGADIAIVYLDEDRDASDTRKLVEAEGKRCLLIKGDVKDAAFCKKAVEQVVKELGGLNI